MTARLLRPFNIDIDDIAHKLTCKLRSKITNHKDKTNVTEKHNAIYMFTCKNCPDKHIGQTCKKIQTKLTVDIKMPLTDMTMHNSLPAKHTDDNGHKFDWSQTRCL